MGGGRRGGGVVVFPTNVSGGEIEERREGRVGCVG